MDWMPMEDAPRDGTKVLLAVNDKVDIGAYRVREHLVNGKRDFFAEGWVSQTYMRGEVSPFAWMPLPDIPCSPAS